MLYNVLDRSLLIWYNLVMVHIINKWKPDEVEFLINNYPIHGADFCAKNLNRTVASIVSKSKREGLKVESPKKATLLSHEEYENKLFEKELDFLPLEQYINTNTPILHECINGHAWKVVPRSILSGQGCPKCNGGVRMSNEEYINKSPFKVMEPYVNSHTPILHECTYGHKWKASPNNILRGRRCPFCSKSGFKLDKPAILYYIKIGEYYKIGVTNRSVKQRFEDDSSSKKITILDERTFNTGEEALNMEKLLFAQFKEYRIIVPGYLRSKGNTELFATNILPTGFLF